MVYNIYMDMLGIGGLIAFVSGWFVAQLGKLLGDTIKKKRVLTFGEFLDAATRSGGMPSGHTASFLALTTYLGINYGFMSGIFVLAACMATIVIYDATNVRYAVGVHGKLLNQMAEESKRKDRKVRVVEGHTIPQVIVGGIIGILIGIVVSMIM